MMKYCLVAILAALAFWCAPAQGYAQEASVVVSRVDELDTIVGGVRKHEPDTLSRFRAWSSRQEDAGSLVSQYAEAHPERAKAVRLLEKLARLVDDAETYADEALANPAFTRNHFHDLILAALASDTRDNALTVEAVGLLADAWKAADAIVSVRENLLSQYQEEIRKGNVRPGTRLAWSLIRIGASDPDTRIVPGSFVYDNDNARIALRHRGADVDIRLDGTDEKKRFRATVNGYTFRSGWAVLLQKPLAWMVETARDMEAAGIGPGYQGEWEVMEAPGGLIALAVSSTGGNGTGGREIPQRAFYRRALRSVTAVPPSGAADQMIGQFRDAAKQLHKGIMADETIPLPLRHALEPILHGAYNPIDKRDYFDNDFCRRLIEADYLEAHITSLSPERQAELNDYRRALASIEAGLDRFAVELDAGHVLIAVSQPDIDVHDGIENAYRDPETGENLSPWEWRLEGPDGTLFHSPMPGRSLYAFSVVEKYPGRHRSRPRGVPAETEVWHAVNGKLAAYRDGDAQATGDADAWRSAVTLDARGRRDGNVGPLGWNFPLYVPVRDDQGDPVLIATLHGVVTTPDFSLRNGDISDENRRKAQDAWLDDAARVLSTPGEMALIYQIFFRYCSDSPLPELPNLIGSHRGLSDTHQTVYQSLERRWVGRLIGDCDDLAEFFQNLAVRQGKLAYVMQLPAHAAAGWLEENPDGGYQFIVLQTGPVLRFTADSREGAVEKAYRHFDDEVGGSHFTAAAVPLLLRFGDDDTRTPFVLSSRIYWDREYAEKMIRVQSYWHLHTYSAAIRIMEEMVRDDREVGNLKELASLYEMAGYYEKSDAMRREELAAVKDDPQATLSTLLDLAQLHTRMRNKDGALEFLSQMETLFRDWRKNKRGLYDRALSFRASWAAVLARLDEPEQAWDLIRDDVAEAWRLDDKLSDTMLRTLLTLYDRMAIHRDATGDTRLSREAVGSRFQVRSALSRAFGKGYFTADDSYNKIHSRYFLLGRYGVAAAGRLAGLQSLWLDGPYPGGVRDHAQRTEDLSEADWEWFRIMPRLYLVYGMEMLDREDYPELYDPVSAKRCLELVERAMREGAGLGSNVMGRDARVKADLILSFIRNDLPAFRQVMELVRSRDYSSLYDDAALVFGAYCGLIPQTDFPAWVREFHEFFPKRQHYFKAAYRALDKGHYDHGVLLAQSAAEVFPGDSLMADEARALEASARHLRKERRERDRNTRDWAAAPGISPAAARLTDLVSFE